MLQVRPPLLQLPYDLGRWAFEAAMIQGLPPDEPEALRLAAGTTWRLEAWLTRGRAALMRDEVRRTFRVSLRTAEAAVIEAYDVAMQSRLEALLLPRLAPEVLGEWVRVRGELSGPCLLVTPHAGNLLMMAVGVARSLALAPTPTELVVFSARGVAPRRRRGIGPVRDTWVNRRLAALRMAAEDGLPVRWESDAGALAGHLAAGRVVMAAFDDRAWPSYVRLDLGEREAVLSQDPWRLAVEAGVPVRPATVHRESDKSHIVTLRPAITPDLRAYLRDEAWPFLLAHPGHYAGWLAECRIRAAEDDHPFFVDYARDTRWMRWPEG